MVSVRALANRAVRWGLLGLVSGLLSCLISQSSLLYFNQKTWDHIAWPGFVFALVVLLPLSRWAGWGWLRTAAVLIASSAVYPVAWWIAAPTTGRPGAYMVGAFAFSGLLGSSVLAVAVLFGRRRWVRAASGTVLLGTIIGGLMGAQLLAAMKGIGSFGSARGGLGGFLVLWQTTVSAALVRGVLPGPDRAAARNAGPTTAPGDSGARSQPSAGS